MTLGHKLNLSQRTARMLLEGIQSGRWAGVLPGVRQLAAELAVSRDVLRAALRQLEDEGLVSHHGAGRSRHVVSGRPAALRVLRIGIFLPQPPEEDNSHTHQLIFAVRQTIESSGHVAFVAPKAATHFRGHAGRINRYLLDCKADAWVFYSANRTILEIAAMLPVPAYALGGLSDGLPLAGSRADLTIPMQDCVDALVARKHRRIVLISPPGAREPQPNRHARVFLDRLQHHGIRADVHFSLPDWEHSPDGLNVLLRSLFSVTPPSALLVMEPECLGPTLVFLASRGLRVPRDVSVVNLLPDPMQAFYRPVIAHFKWAVQPHTRRLCQWLSAIAVNRPDHRMQTTAPAFCPAESIGTHHTP